MVEPDGPDAQRAKNIATELDQLIRDAGKKANNADHYADSWQYVHVVLGLLATVLAALAGAAALAATAGRIPAAIMALTAAGLAAANSFLRSDERYDRNLARRNAWQALERDARLEKANVANHSADDLYGVVLEMYRRWIAINEFEHKPVPPSALSDPASAMTAGPTKASAEGPSKASQPSN
jgi:hypothetical protein